MTDQPPNDQFRASSFSQGYTAAYIGQLHGRFARDPSSVDAGVVVAESPAGLGEAVVEAIG